MEMKKIALIGAGAVGAYYIYGFTKLEGISFCVVAEGERAKRLKENGIHINGIQYFPEIKTPEEAHGADLLIVTTKYQGLFTALDAIKGVCDEHTTVISLLNGIDSEGIIGDYIGQEHMVYSLMRIPSRRVGNEIRFAPEKVAGAIIGEKHTKEVTPRLQAIADLFDKAGLRYTLSDHIIKEQWLKYCMNISNNLPQAVLGVGFGAYYDSEYMKTIRDRMYEEVCAVGEAEGVHITEWVDWREVCLPSARFSTLQDLDAGRRTEIDMFLGVLIKLAKKHGVAVPFSEYTYLAIKALEEKNEGKFEY